MKIETIAYGGWPNNLRLQNDHVELIVTLDVGPRIISYRTLDGANVLKQYDEQLGGTGETEWQIRGGHRLWLAPETEASYAPDNTPVQHTVLENGVRLEVPASRSKGSDGLWGVRRVLTVTLEEDSSEVHLVHEAINDGAETVEVATWGLSVMAPGGLELIPTPPLSSDIPKDWLPNRVVVPWPYTDLTDARLRLGWKFTTLRQTTKGGPVKIGLLHREGWVAYLNGASLFVKTFGYEEGERYPDFGCNFETYTCSEMLEVESLGPLRTLAPGASTSHEERWALLNNVPQPASLKEEELAEWVAPLLARLEIPYSL